MLIGLSKRVYIGMHERACERCGEIYAPKEPCSRFCSHFCSRAKVWPSPTKLCESCGEAFSFKDVACANLGAFAARRFCSKKCYGASLRRPAVSCGYCGTEFHPVAGRSEVYCSIPCFHAYVGSHSSEPPGRRATARRRRGHGFTPSQKKALLRRAGCRCEACGSAENLECDHVVPVANGGTRLISNGQVLCRPCHVAKTERDYWSVRRAG